jgi:FkbM family methyltransferase
MNTNLSVFLYRFFPTSAIRTLGGLRILKPLRNLILKDAAGGTRTVHGNVHYRLEEGVEIDYVFHAPAKMLVKAQEKGIENIITRNVYHHCKQQPNGILLDIGANFGALSLTWATSMPQHSIHSFEVHPRIFKALEDSKRSNGLTNFHPRNQAVSDAARTLTFSLETKTAQLNGNHPGSTEHRVEAVTIDATYANSEVPVLAMKVDTDGSDFEVLRGASEVLKKFMPYLAVETNEDIRILEELWSHGYRIVDMRGETVELGSRIDIRDERYCNVFGYPPL